jgi:Domain of unknown function (DUF6438)
MAIIRSGGLRILVLLLSFAALGAAEPPRDPDIIRYEETACFGFCPVFVVTVGRDGQGLFEGRQHTAVQGTRRFRMTRAQFTALAAKLAPLRPASGHISYDYDTRCQGAGVPPTDGASTNIGWREGRKGQSLHFYSGCPQRSVSLRLFQARAMLPIKAFIGQPCLRGRCR